MKAENSCSISWERVSERERLAIALGFDSSYRERMLAAPVKAMFVIQNQGIGSCLGYAHTVIISGHGGEIHNK